MQLSLTTLRSNTHDLRHALECGETVELTFHGKVIGLVNPVETQNDKYDKNIINAYFNKRAGDDPYTAINELKQSRSARIVK